MVSDFFRTALLYLRALCILLILLLYESHQAVHKEYDEHDHCGHCRGQTVISALLQVEDRKTDRLCPGTREHGRQRQLRQR